MLTYLSEAAITMTYTVTLMNARTHGNCEGLTTYSRNSALYSDNLHDIYI